MGGELIAMGCELIQTVEGMETGSINQGKSWAQAGTTGLYTHTGSHWSLNYRLNFFFLAVLEFKLRASHFLGRCSTTWAQLQPWIIG
jgi:hypothetical protein